MPIRSPWFDLAGGMDNAGEQLRAAMFQSAQAQQQNKSQLVSAYINAMVDVAQQKHYEAQSAKLGSETGLNNMLMKNAQELGDIEWTARMPQASELDWRQGGEEIPDPTNARRAQYMAVIAALNNKIDPYAMHNVQANAVGVSPMGDREFGPVEMAGGNMYQATPESEPVYAPKTVGIAPGYTPHSQITGLPLGKQTDFRPNAVPQRKPYDVRMDPNNGPFKFNLETGEGYTLVAPTNAPAHWGRIADTNAPAMAQPKEQSIPTPKTQKEYNMLSPGTVYIDTDGKTKRKK